MDIVEQIQELLNKEGIWADVYHSEKYPSCTVTVFIHGDWKHDHLRAEHLISTLGYSQVREDVIGNQDSDCYKSEHTFIKGSKEFVESLHKMFGI